MPLKVQRHAIRIEVTCLPQKCLTLDIILWRSSYIQRYVRLRGQTQRNSFNLTYLTENRTRLRLGYANICMLYATMTDILHDADKLSAMRVTWPCGQSLQVLLVNGIVLLEFDVQSFNFTILLQSRPATDLSLIRLAFRTLSVSMSCRILPSRS